MEQELLNRIRRGDLSAGEVLTNAGSGQSVQAFGNVQSLYAMRLNLHQLLTLVSRAAVDGGLPQRTAFSLCSDYRSRLEKSRTAKELTQIGNEMVRDYAARVHNMKRYVRCSPAIRLCCEYIDTHPADKLTLEGLAAKAGYSPSHLSRKFYREMGCSIITYIQNSKLERACYLLANTTRSVDDISAELGFNARSYFTTVFKITSVCPLPNTVGRTARCEIRRLLCLKFIRLSPPFGTTKNMHDLRMVFPMRSSAM